MGMARFNHLWNLEYHVGNRIPYDKRGQMMKDKAMEFNWRFDSANNTDKQLFTHMMIDSYNQPSGFDFENGNSITPENIAQKAKDLVQIFSDRSKSYKTDHLMFLCKFHPLSF
jgi:hypothetical protein